MKKQLLFNTSLLIVFAVSLSFLFSVGMHKQRSATVSSQIRTMNVILDAGHGGEDGGAVGRRGELEKDVNLEITKKLELILNLCGVETVMTRSEDISLGENESVVLRHRKVADIRARTELVKKNPDSILISIHQNSFPQDSSCRGAQVFYSQNNVGGKVLAENVQRIIKKSVDKNNKREAKAADKNIFLLNNVNCPAILVECGFLTNDEESRLLMTEKYRIRLAAAIASGFMEYKAVKRNDL